MEPHFIALLWKRAPPLQLVLQHLTSGHTRAGGYSAPAGHGDECKQSTCHSAWRLAPVARDSQSALPGPQVVDDLLVDLSGRCWRPPTTRLLRRFVYVVMHYYQMIKTFLFVLID